MRMFLRDEVMAA